MKCADPSDLVRDVEQSLTVVAVMGGDAFREEYFLRLEKSEYVTEDIFLHVSVDHSITW